MTSSELKICMAEPEREATRTVFIPAAGRGSRLALEGVVLPKPLITTSGLPILSHIIDLYPTDWHIVIALGHEGDIVRESIEAIYSDRLRDQRLSFCYTKSFLSKGAGLSQTLLDSKEILGNQPFIFHACDSLIRGADSTWTHWIRPKNQILVSQPEAPGHYRLLDENPEGTYAWRHDWIDPEKTSVSVYTGIAHIYDTSRFWVRLSGEAATSPEGGESIGLDPSLLVQVPLVKERWTDTGSIKGYQGLAASPSKDINILQKSDEAIWFTGTKTVKMHMDQAFIAGRVERGLALNGFVPEITSHGRNTFTYSYVEGGTLSAELRKDSQSMDSFLAYLLTFWFGESLPLFDVAGRKYSDRTRYLKFYRTKTLERTLRLTEHFPSVTHEGEINGVATPALNDQLKKIDWNLLASPLMGRVHGDLHPENVLVTKSGEYVLLDWRQDVAGSKNAFGDVYYDLGKLAHGLRVDHGVIARGEFTVSRSSSGAHEYSISEVPSKLIAYELLQEFCRTNGLDWSRVLLIESLIYLNIAILHKPDDYTRLLALMGRNLLRSVTEMK